MQSCSIMISTKVDGTANEITREGAIELKIRSVKFVYHEENALVTVLLGDNKAKISRVGDYTMSLLLESGKLTDGTIGIGNQVGVVQTNTRAVEYKITEDYVVARLFYDLVIGCEKQEMELRLLAKLQ